MMILDELTQLYDRRALNQQLVHEVSRTARIGDPFCVMMIDVDHFKDVNDNLGHLRGDRILMEVAQVLKQNCRQMDIPCRYGGDEFVVILPSTRCSEAETMAKRVLEKVRTTIFHGYDNQPDIHITVSIGIAECPKDIDDPKALLDRADKALYLSKSKGRNCFSSEKEIQKKTEKPSLNFQSFVNRHEPLESLKEKFNVVLTGNAHLIMVYGEAGIGKTRLILELKKYSKLRQSLFLTSRPFEFGVTPPYQIFFDLIKEYIQLDGAKHLQLFSALASAYKAELQKFLPELRLTLASTSEFEKLSPDQEKIRLFEAIYLVFEAISRQTPLLLFLDDLQWVRETDLELFGYLLRSIKQLPIMFCGAFRVEEISETHPLKRFMSAMSREYSFFPVELIGLIYSDVQDLLQKILGFGISEEVNRRIFAETGGNPFYIEEIVKSLVENGSIYWDKNQWICRNIEEIHLPGSVSDLLHRRIETLDAELKDLLTQAAVIGHHFSLKLLKELSEKNEGHLFDLLDVGMNKLLVNPEANDVFTFSNILIQRAFYNEIPLLRRRRLHTLAAQAIETLYAEHLPDYWETLVRHYQVAEDWGKVLHYTLKAAKKLKELYANQDAVSRYMECLDLLKVLHKKDPALEIDIYKDLGEIHFLTGEYQKAMEYLQELLHRQDIAVKDRTDCRGLLGRVYTWLGDFPKAVSYFEEAKKGLDAKIQRVEIAELEIQELWIHAKRGAYEMVEGSAEKTLEVLKEAGSDLNIGFVYNILGNIFQEKGDIEKAEEYHQKSFDHRKKTGALDEIARGYNNLGEIAYIKGRMDQAIEFFNEGLQLKVKSGERFGISYMSTSLGLALTENGQLDKARGFLEDSLGIAQAINSDFLLAYSLMANGLLYLRKGDHEKSIRLANQALEIAERINEIARSVEARHVLAQNFLVQGKKAEAVELLKKAEKICLAYGCKHLLAVSRQLLAKANS